MLINTSFEFLNIGGNYNVIGQKIPCCNIIWDERPLKLGSVAFRKYQSFRVDVMIMSGSSGGNKWKWKQKINWMASVFENFIKHT